MQNVKKEYFLYGPKEMEYLSRADNTLGKEIERLGYIQREVIPNLFEALLHSIVAQQISTKAASTVWGRMQERCLTITADVIAPKSIEEIAQCGMSTRKATYISDLAMRVARKELDLEELTSLSDGDVIKKLSSLRGIGVWTAEMLLLNSMKRPDVLSFGDIAIKRAMMKLYGLAEINKEQFDAYRRRYAPYGSVASIYLWKLYSEQ